MDCTADLESSKNLSGKGVKSYMRIKTSLTLLFCTILLWVTPEVAQPMAGEKVTTDPLQAVQVSSEENGLTQVIGATTGRTLDEGLVALEQAHGIHIFLHPAVNKAERVADDVGDPSPEAALRFLLRGYDFFLQYGAEGEDGANRLRRVWVFPRNEGDRQQIVSEHVLEAALQPVRRGYAEELRDAMARSTEEAQSVVAHALNDEDENTRHDVLQTALQEGLPVSPSLLESALLHDQSDVMRAAAFDALILRSESDTIDVSAIIDLASQDPSPLVQSRALALREVLGTPVEPPQPEQDLMIEPPTMDSVEPRQPEQELISE